MWIETRVIKRIDFGGTQGETMISCRDLRTDSGTTPATPPPVTVMYCRLGPRRFVQQAFGRETLISARGWPGSGGDGDSRVS